MRKVFSTECTFLASMSSTPIDLKEEEAEQIEQMLAIQQQRWSRRQRTDYVDGQRRAILRSTRFGALRIVRHGPSA